MLRLRPYQPSDAQYIVNWLTDEKSFYRWSAGRFGEYPLTAEKMNRLYAEWSENFYKMTAVDEGGVVGHFTVRFMAEALRNVRLGFIVVDDKVRGKGYGKRMLALALEFAFNIMKAERVSLGVFENNPSAHHCYLAVGFKDTGGGWSCHLMEEDWPCREMEIKAEEYFGNKL